MTDSAGNAKRYSFRLLSYRARSERELRERLEKKGFPEEVISSTLKSLVRSGFLDDRALASNLKRQAFENKLLGYEGAKSFMMKRGLSREVVESALGYDEDTEARNIQKLLDKKLKSMGNYLTEGEQKRLWSFLARRGYSFGIIKKALRELKFNKEEEE